MKLPRDLSGREVVDSLVRMLGYRVVHEKGSHIVIETDSPSRQRIVVPDHKVLRLGTLNAVPRAVAAHKGLDKNQVAALLR